MGGLLKISSFFKSSEVYEGDFNNVTSGIFAIPGISNENQPVARYGVLVAFMNEETYCMQFFVAIEDISILYVRCRDTQTLGWKKWVKFVGVSL